MKLLLTSAGISNNRILDALVDLLGKPIADSSALCVPTAIYPFRGGPSMAYRFINGTAPNPMCELGSRSLGVLELTALPSIKEEIWTAAVLEADALLVWGGDVLYLRHWMRQSGLADLLKSRQPNLVYVGVSAGSIVATSTIGETFTRGVPSWGDDVTSEDVLVATPEGELNVTFAVAPGMGLVDLSLLPHVDHESFPENSMANMEIWATKVPGPMYGIDDQTAIKVVNGAVEVVSEGNWKRFGG